VDLSLRETKKLAGRQQGPSNINLARDIQKSRLEAGRQTAGGTGASERRSDYRTGTARDKPSYQLSAAKKAAARGAPPGGRIAAQQKQAEAEAKALSNTLGELRKRLEAAFPGRPGIAREVGLPEQVGVGPGATVALKDLSGQTKIVTGVIKAFGDQTATVTRVLSERIRGLIDPGMAGGPGRVEQLGRMARRRPEQAVSLMRGEMRKALELPVMQRGAVMQAYQKGGEAELRLRPTGEQKERLSRLKDEASVIAEVNKMVYGLTGSLEQLKSQGVEVISSLGLGEATAARARIIREPETKAVAEVQMPVQTRALAGMGLLGAGGMRQARSHLVTQIQEMVGGEMPKIMGRGEREAYEAGAFRPAAVRHLRTAVAAPTQIPELAEDQILVDKDVMMDVVRTRSKVMAQLAEGMKVGEQLREGMVLGADIEGGQVTFDAKGVNAKVKEIEKIWEDGVEGVRVTIEETSKLMTGEKITTMGGFKGIVKKVPKLAETYGLPPGTEAAVSAVGMAKRGILKDPATMMASEIAKAVGVSGQEVADRIEAAMREGGQDFATAVEGVAEQFGLKGFTGAGRGAAMVGELPWGRLEPQAGAGREPRFFDVAAMKGLEQRAGTAGMVEDMRKRMEDFGASNADFIQQLKVMSGAVDVASEALEQFLPEEFGRLPAGRVRAEEFAGTIMDPKYQAAMAVRMPERAGGERLMRVPGMGPGLGQRAAFKTPLGLRQAEAIAKQFDRMLETATQIRAARGDIPLQESSEAAAEAANMTGRAIKDIVQGIVKMGTKTEEGKAAIDAFVNRFIPFVEQLEGAADIKYAEIGRGGERVIREETRTAAEYVKSRRTPEQRMFAVQDILAERAAKRTEVRPGTPMARRGVAATESIARLGAVHKNAELLQQVMGELGITLQKDSAHVENLHSRLEQLEEGLVSLLTSEATGRVGGTVDPRRRRLMQQAGGGLSSAEFRTAVQFPTDVGKELEQVGTRLRAMRDAGQDVSQSLEALDRMVEAQKPGKGIPRDIVVINQKDYEALVEAVSREEKIPMAEAGRRLERPGLLHRFPTTGPASFLPTKLRVGEVPPGKMGVAGPAAVSSMEDLAKVTAPLKARLSELAEQFDALRGVGPAAEEIRGEMRTLSAEIDAITPSFASARQNLDFDGDKLTWHADVATKTGRQLETLAEQARGTSVAFEAIATGIIGKVAPPKVGEGVRGYGELFARTAKLRTGAERAAVLAPETAEMAGREAFAHVAPKKAVGLLTDMFNQMMLAVQGGSKEVGDAAAAGMSRIMLAINEGLGMKHGAGGVPTRFVEDLRKGQIGQIQKGMEAGGEDFYGGLGRFNEEYREKIRQGLRQADEAAVRALGEQEGVIGDDLVQVIDQLVDKLDLKAVIRRMFDMMQENMRAALQKEGLGGPEIEAEMGAMLKPGGPGLDITRIMKNLFPAYAMTRGRAEREMAGMPQMEKIQKILGALPQDMAEQITDFSVDEGALMSSADEVAGTLHKSLTRWIARLRSRMEVATPGEMQAAAGGEPLAARSRGMYVERPGEAAGAGRILVNLESTIKPFIRAMQDLDKVAKGIDPGRGIEEIKRDLLLLPEIFTHEELHRANKQFTASVESIITQLETGTGVIGKHSMMFIKRMVQNVPNVKAAYDKLIELTKAEQRGVKMVGGAPIGEARQAARRHLTRTVAEEAIGYQAQPERFGKIMEGLPEDLVASVVEHGRQVVTSEAGRLAAAGAEISNVVRMSLADGAISAARGDGPEVAEVRRAAQERIEDRMKLDYPGRAGVMMQRERLGLGERALAAGREELKIPERIEMPPMTKEMEGWAQEVATLLESAGEAAGDPKRLRQLQRDLISRGEEYQSRIKGLQEKGKFKGVQPYMEAQKLIRQFQARVAEQMITNARELERSIAEMRAAGKTEGPEFREKVQEFEDSVERLFEFYASTLRPVGRGKGQIVSPIATAGGQLMAPAMEAGVTPTPATYRAMMEQVAGRGPERETFKHMMGPLEEVRGAIKEGSDASEQWSKVWTALISKPEYFATNMTKVVEIMSKFAKMMGPAYATAAQELEKMAGFAKQFQSQMKKGPAPKTIEGIYETAGKAAGTRRLAEMGRPGGLAESIEAQYREAIATAERRAEQLSKVVGTDAFKKLKAAGRQFEPLKFDIIDPETGQVVQRMSAQFKQAGKQIKVSMAQAGVATNQFGNQMRNAFRRVVQWGFASGIIYGTIRALRRMVQVVTDVQTKIAGLQKVMNVTITNFEDMQEGAASMARSFGIAIEEVLDGMVVYAQQGLRVNEIMERTRSTLLAVNVTTLTSKEATEALTSVMKLFAAEVGNSERAVDAWAAVAAKHAITAKDLALAVQKTGAAAKTAGVSFNDLLGITTAIGAVTRETGKEVATGLRFMMRAMRRPKAQRELLGLGVRSMDVAGDLRPAIDVLGDVALKWAELSRAQQLATAQAMAGIRHYNKFIVLMQNWTEALDASVDAQNSSGFAARKNELAIATLAKQTQMLSETFKGLALDLGKTLLPAMTMLVKGAKWIVGGLEVLPDMFKQVGIAALGGMVVAHKALDLVLDSLDALTGYGSREAVKGAGVAGLAWGGLKKVAKGIKSSIAGMGAAFTTQTRAVKSMSEAMKMTAAVEGMGAVSKAIYGARTATVAWVRSLKTLRGVMITTGVGALAVALGVLIAAFVKTRKTGKGVEDEMFGIIGRTKDSIDQLGTMSQRIKKTTHAWAKYQSAVRAASDPVKLAIDIEAATFKSPLKALKEYEDTAYDVGVALATLDPSAIEGISEAGAYIYTASEAMNALATSAMDAKKATMAAMQTKVIEQYTKDLTEANKGWKKLVEWMSLGKVDKSLLADIVKIRKEMNKLAEERKELAGRGILTDQDKMNKLLDQELKKRGEILAVAGELRRVLGDLPLFDNQELARVVASSDKIRKSFAALAETGIMGREATGGGLAMQYMARNIGLGGIVGPEATANVQRFFEEMVERGMEFRPGGPRGAGAAVLLDEDAARAMLKIAVGAEKLADVEPPEEVLNRARLVLTGVDKASGEILYYFEDAMSGAVARVRESQLGPELQEAINGAFTLDKSQVEEAAEKTRKLLTLQSVGALAGIRVPEGGMPEIGPARRRDLTVEQRIMEAMPDQLQRMAEVQSELTQIGKRYNEQLSENADMSENQAANLQDQLRVLTPLHKEMVRNLQLENMRLSTMAHMEGAIAKLNQTMEQAAAAARDAAIEEETRLELMRETTGALAGLPVVPQLDFGKVLRELSAQERLQVEMGPGFSKTLARLAGVEKTREARVGVVTDIRKQIADFNEMFRDLESSTKKLSEQQKLSIKAKIAGVTPDAVKVSDAIQKGAQAQLSELKRQTPTLDRIEDKLGTLVQLGEAETPEERAEIIRRGLGEVKGADILKVLGGAGANVLEKFMETQVGIRARKEPTWWQRQRGDIYERAGAEAAPIEFRSKATKKEFGKITKELEGLYEDQKTFREDIKFARQAAGPRGARRPSLALMDVRRKIDAANEALLSIPEVAEAARAFAANLAEKEVVTQKATEVEERNLERENLINKVREMRLRVLGQLNDAQKKTIADTEEASRILMAKKGFGLAMATQSLANSIEQTIEGFKKAEMLFYQKVGSDIEGAFARVGQPEFRTPFEQRRREVAEKYGAGMRGMTLEEMGARDKELVDIEFDEKEARIKQAQDIEVAALRQQQSQAEKFRDVLSEAMMRGDLAPETARMARGFFDTLTDQLIESEQARMERGELVFEGVPALEDARNFLQKLNQQAKEQAKKAEREFLVATYKTGITDPITKNQLEQIGLLRSIDTALSRTAGAAAPPALGGAALGGGRMYMPTGMIPKGKGPVDLQQYMVGLSNRNQMADWGARAASGNATATDSGVLTTRDVSGRPRAPGSVEEQQAPAGGRAPDTTQAETTQSLVDAISDLQETLSSLAKQGFQIDSTDFVGAVESTGLDIVAAIEAGTEVTITNQPVSVNVENISEIGTTAVGAVGAQIDTLASRISSVEDNVSTIADERITEALADLPDLETIATNLDEAGVGVNELDARVEALEGDIESLSGQLDTSVVGELTAIQETVETFGERLDTDEDTLAQISDRVVQIDENVVTALNASTEAKDLAEQAMDAANETVASLAALREELAGRDRDVTGDIRLLTANLDDAGRGVTENAGAISELRGKVEKAVQTADAARSAAQAAKRN
jgi:TP901 family phage tail tape measure protein